MKLEIYDIALIGNRWKGSAINMEYKTHRLRKFHFIRDSKSIGTKFIRLKKEIIQRQQLVLRL